MIHFDVENKEKELKELESKTTENDFGMIQIIAQKF